MTAAITRTAAFLALTMAACSCGSAGYYRVESRHKVGGHASVDANVNATVTYVLRLDITGCSTLDKDNQAQCILDMLDAYKSLGDLSALITKETTTEGGAE